MGSGPAAERARLDEASRGVPWRRWGPYLSERAWGTVREDYSAGGDAWGFFPHDHARSRAYRWNEEGLAGICDDQQVLCFALAMWNGRDPILKERIFGLTGPQGNHGEDAKEYWWYLDATPTHSWMRWRYVYPQAAFPYDRLLEESLRRTRLDPEFELVDTGALDGGRYWEVTADFAKAAPEDVCIRLTVRNAGPDEADIDVLPTLWFRNTWSWAPDSRRPEVRAEGGAVTADHWRLGTRVLTSSGTPDLLFCDNETNVARLWGQPNRTPYPKDGINDHVVQGSPTVNPDRRGTRCALRHKLTVGPGQSARLRLRLAPAAGSLDADFEQVMALRESEAGDFYRSILPAGLPAEEALVARQALSGMLWSKQFFHYDVESWLDGDPGQPAPPEARRDGRNHRWRHLDAAEVISMPDKWEYPWFAAWDLAFHSVSLAHLDPELAKSQLLLLAREWYMHPSGQLPAYEWSFDDVNPPVQPLAALRVFDIDGGTDHEFLERLFHKLLINFTWWVNREDSRDDNLFEGGFLGMDNIGPFDRDALPVPGVVEQSDGTSWMAAYCLGMLEMSLRLAVRDDTYEELAIKFLEHFALIARAINHQGLWDEQDGFYYDRLRTDDGQPTEIRARSLVGLIPLIAVTVIPQDAFDRLPSFSDRVERCLRRYPDLAEVLGPGPGGAAGGRLLSIVSPDRLRRILACMLSERELLSPFGVRSLSKAHAAAPLVLDLGGQHLVLDYEPAESRTNLFGGNSNWRGPVWFPVNYLLIESLRRFHTFLGSGFTVECPTGSGRQLDLAGVADELSRRLLGVFLDGPDGRRPVFGPYRPFQEDPSWHGQLLFYEYFNGDTGMGLGASHQTGWTGLVADLAMRLQPAPATALVRSPR
jgi:hypothetical protein